MLVGLVGCDGLDRSTDDHGPPTHWITEAQHEVGTDALFSWVPYLRVSGDGQRVFVIEPTAGTVSVWTPDDSLLFAVGRPGEGPGEFVNPYRVHVQEDGAFHVRDRQRFTYFSATGEWLNVMDATETHVWGVWTDSLDVPHVVGRRLVPG